MSTRIFSFVVVVAVLIVSQAPAISDTNEPATPILPAPKTLAVLAQRMAATDRVISTNQGGAMAGHPGFSFSISADDVQRIVHAVSAASYVGSQEHPDFEWDWKLQFYTGTNFLAAICFAHDTFLADGVYRDDTGVLEEIYRDSSNREYVSRVYKNQDKEFAESKKAEAKEWLKSPLHTILGEDKKKVLKYVNDFYAAGAPKVFVAEIETQMNGKSPPRENAKYLCVVLPNDRDTRRKVFSVHWQAVREWGFDADDDVGQKYTWYPIDWHDLK